MEKNLVWKWNNNFMAYFYIGSLNKVPFRGSKSKIGAIHFCLRIIFQGHMQNFTEKMDRKKLEPVLAKILHAALQNYFKTKILMTIFDFGPLKGTLFYDRN